MHNDDFPNISGAKYGIKACRGAIGSNFGACSSTEAYRASSQSSHNSKHTGDNFFSTLFIAPDTTRLLHKTFSKFLDIL